MATLRFGIPAATDAEQVILGTRWGDPTVPRRDAWRETFVYGIGMTATAHNATWRTVGGSGNTSSPIDTSAERLTALTHPDSGVIPNHFNTVVHWNAVSSTSTGWMTTLDALPGVPIKLIQGFVNDVDGEWLALSDAQAGAGNIDAVLAAPLAAFGDSPSIIGYCLADDFQSTGDRGDRAGELMDRIPQLDPYGRPASPSWISSSSMVTDDQIDIFITGAGSYPNRYNGSGGSRVEGDFTFADPQDWANYFRNIAIDRPTSNIWVWAQAHQLNVGGGGVNDLEYPTAGEIRKQVWELVGAGVRGILWFLYQDESETDLWVGLAHPDSAARMAAVAEMGSRLTPNIRRRLMTAAPVADQFTASGGGATYKYITHAAAYIRTLYDAGADVYYCVVCNRSANSAAVTISSDTLSGSLVNLEDGSSLALGDAVTLAPLDGTIFRLNPVTGFGLYTIAGDRVTW